MLRLQTPNGETKVLLHTCCAPCSSAILECLLANNIQLTVYYYNPNIYPEEEYLRRKAESIRYAKFMGVNFVDADYDYQSWHSQMCGLENEPERGKRCLKCFTMRLLKTAEYASHNDFTLITTTLASSRWKLLDQINTAGNIAANQFPGISFWTQNWRRGGLTERRAAIIREQDFYNQKYCGCEFSLINN